VVAPGLMVHAAAFLQDQTDCAAVAGRLRELRPDASVYNLLCDMEWDVPPGKAEQTGGIFMVRRRAFDDVGGFREELTAGEEPDLCSRLIHAGWGIMRLREAMAIHDASIMRFSQWWKRCVRGGHAARQNWSMADPAGRSHSRGMVVRAMLWGIALPAACICAVIVLPALGRGTAALATLLAVLLVLLLQILRVSVQRRRRGNTVAHAMVFSLFNCFFVQQIQLLY